MANRFEIPALIAAATVGDGVFALPYVFMRAGWLTVLLYLVGLAGLVVLAHGVYLKTLEKEQEKKRLLGLARDSFGAKGFWAGFVAIVIGLILTLLAFLLLGAQFIQLALPALPPDAAYVIFWAFISVPVFLNARHVRELELIGIAATACAVILIFFAALPQITESMSFFGSAPVVGWRYAFLPFGAVLFSLAGWTSIEQVYEARKAEGELTKIGGIPVRSRIPWLRLAFGTAIAALLYTAFSAGILGSAPVITPDTASGLALWPFWKREVFAMMGLIAVSTVYLPISREVKNALEKDLRWGPLASRAMILFIPPALIGLGLRSFIGVIGIVGSVFLGMQYLLIIAIGRRVTAPGPVKRFFLDLAALVFIAAAVYEIATFVVH